MTATQIREYMDWPEYRLSVPETVDLKCPECGSVIVCDVQDNAYLFVAEIDTDRCEECGKKMCPKCPSDEDEDGFRICKECSERND